MYVMEYYELNSVCSPCVCFCTPLALKDFARKINIPKIAVTKAVTMTKEATTVAARLVSGLQLANHSTVYNRVYVRMYVCTYVHASM